MNPTSHGPLRKATIQQNNMTLLGKKSFGDRELRKALPEEHTELRPERWEGDKPYKDP